MRGEVFMSIILTNAYRKVFKEYAINLGFKQKGSLFIRAMKDEIVQTFYLFKGGTPNEFTLNIGIYPFCLNNDKTSFKEGNFRLEDFIDNRTDWWEYNPFDYSSTTLVVTDVLNHFSQKVFPILNKIKDCRSYLDYLNEYELERYGEVLWNSYHKLLPYLKIQDYEKASIIIEEMERQSLDAASANKTLYTTSEEYQEYLKIIKADLAKLYEIKNAINENNKEFINALITHNENNTNNILKQYGIISRCNGRENVRS